MQTNSHSFLNSNGSLNYDVANGAARDARSEALRAIYARLLHVFRRLASRVAPKGHDVAHAE